MLILLVIVLLILTIVVAAFSTRRLVRGAVVALTVSVAVAFVVLWVNRFLVFEKDACRQSFPEHFGYRGELASGVTPVRSWWPVGYKCQGFDISTGDFVSIPPISWFSTFVLYGAVSIALAALCGLALAVYQRVNSRRSPELRPPTN
jgi:hypothetical protein